MADGCRLNIVPANISFSPCFDGKKVIRPYTISSSPTRPDYCEITVKREENGFVSRHLHNTLRQGDIINLSAPAGHFIFDGTQGDSIVLIAGGVGITPMMAITRYLTDNNWKGDIFFIFCAKTPRDIIYRNELEELQKRFSNLRLLITLSRADGPDWTGHKGRITAEFLTKTIPDLAKHPVYICGPMTMMTPTIQLLRDLGVPAEQIKSEEFVAAKRIEAGAMDMMTTVVSVDAISTLLPDEAETTLTFSRSDKSVALSPDKTQL
jgi:ferredoxin-NADP reductase